jgi:hypothetical protein
MRGDQLAAELLAKDDNYAVAHCIAVVILGSFPAVRRCDENLIRDLWQRSKSVIYLSRL